MSEPTTIITLDALSGGGIQIDAEAGEIRNVSVITKGAAMGHGFEIDDTMLKQVTDGINRRKSGLKMRLGHPGWSDGVGTVVGRISNARQEADRVRADVRLGDYAADLPGGGNARDYLLKLAASDPQFVGLSIAFIPADFKGRKDESGNPLPPLGRVREVLAVDFVDEPAANRKGLLSASPAMDGAASDAHQSDDDEPSEIVININR